MPPDRAPGAVARAICPACGRVLVDGPGELCPCCALVQHQVRRGERVAGDQRRLGC